MPQHQRSHDSGRLFASNPHATAAVSSAAQTTVDSYKHHSAHSAHSVNTQHSHHYSPYDSSHSGHSHLQAPTRHYYDTTAPASAAGSATHSRNHSSHSIHAEHVHVAHADAEAATLESEHSSNSAGSSSCNSSSAVSSATASVNIAAGRSSIVSVLCCMLEQIAAHSEKTLPRDPHLISMFHTSCLPSISISQYLQRISKYSEVSAEGLIQAVLHIHRLMQGKNNYYHNNMSVQHAMSPAAGSGACGIQVRNHSENQGFYVGALNLHRLLLTSIMCTAKFFDDSYYNNAYYSKIGGVSVCELNHLEVEFLALINFELFIPAHVYAAFYRDLCTKPLHSHCGCKHKTVPSLLLDPLFQWQPASHTQAHEHSHDGYAADEELQRSQCDDIYDTHSHAHSHYRSDTTNSNYHPHAQPHPQNYQQHAVHHSSHVHTHTHHAQLDVHSHAVAGHSRTHSHNQHPAYAHITVHKSHHHGYDSSNMSGMDVEYHEHHHSGHHVHQHAAHSHVQHHAYAHDSRPASAHVHGFGHGHHYGSATGAHRIAVHDTAASPLTAAYCSPTNSAAYSKHSGPLTPVH